MITKKFVVLLGQMFHTKGALIIFYAFFIERELFIFEIFSCSIAYACEYSKRIFCSATQMKDNQNLYKNNQQEGFRYFCKKIWQNRNAYISMEKTFMFSLNIKNTINRIPSRFMSKVFSINAVVVLITQKNNKYSETEVFIKFSLDPLRIEKFPDTLRLVERFIQHINRLKYEVVFWSGNLF